MINTTRGQCTCCGQIIELELEHNPSATADAKATMLCTCSEARTIQKSYQDEVSAIQRREEVLKNAKEYIGKMFGTDEENEHVAFPDTTVELLIKHAAMVYDGLLGNVSLNLPYGVKAKIAKKKGGLKIERQNTDGEAIEI